MKASFYVGQRVRIKWSNSWPELAGRTGTVIGKLKEPDVSNPRCEYQVQPDGFNSHLISFAGSYAYFCPNGDQLAPATDSYDKISWAACIWRPEHLQVTP